MECWVHFPPAHGYASPRRSPQGVDAIGCSGPTIATAKSGCLSGDPQRTRVDLAQAASPTRSMRP